MVAWTRVVGNREKRTVEYILSELAGRLVVGQEEKIGMRITPKVWA